MTNARLRCAALLLAASFAHAVQASDWPRFRGPDGDGVANEGGAADWLKEGLKKLWSADLGDGGGGVYSGTAVLGGRVFIMGKTADKDVLYALDARTGKELWNFEYEAPGEQRTYGSGARATPTVSGGLVFILSKAGLLHALDEKTGAKVWLRDLGKDYGARAPAYGHSGSPLVSGDLVIVQAGGLGAAVVALDARTGKEAWKRGDEKAGYAAPQLATLSGTKQALVFSDAGLAALDPANGREFWRVAYRDPQSKNIPQPLVLGDTVYLCNRARGFTALKVSRDGEAWKTEALWTNPKESLHFSSPVPGDGVLYFHDGSGNVKCLDLKDGSVRWKLPGLGAQQAQLVRVGAKRLIALTDSGELALLEDEVKTGRELARFQAVGRQSFAAFAVADGRIYVRDDRVLACFELPGK